MRQATNIFSLDTYGYGNNERIQFLRRKKGKKRIKISKKEVYRQSQGRKRKTLYRRQVTSQSSMNSLTINKGCKAVTEMCIPIALEIRKKGSEAFANEDHPQLSNTVEPFETILKKNHYKFSEDMLKFTNSNQKV